MPTLKIDGREVTVEKGRTIIQACEQLSIEVPRYCYHPGLRVVGSCRMCLVDVEKMPKLQIACNTPANDDMVVWTQNDKVKEARRSVLEFLLLNHPLDCPVCDRAGECELQNYYMKYAQHDSRLLENKVKKKKAFPIGPHVILDQERCVLCSRCVRFTSDVTQTGELGIFSRATYSEVNIYPGRELNNNYSGNVVDICPVGALLDRDFRYQMSVWYLKEAMSVCPGCSNGCNIRVHYNLDRRYKTQGRRFQRLKPRYNEHVNKYWMCDEGRYNYRWLDVDRIEQPQIRDEEGLKPSDWDSAFAKAAAAMKTAIEAFGVESIGVIPSPQMTNEEL
jgi:NADH-quinone oxidoreductase subunit G